MKRRYVLVLCLLVLALFVTVAPLAAQDDSACPQTGSTFTFGVDSMIPFDPLTSNSDWSYYVITNVFSMLFRIESGQPVPDLAESWDISDDGTVYTWHLRHGMMWQDGNDVFPEGKSREVVASDVVYSLTRSVDDPGSMLPADMRQVYKSIEATDDYTVVLTLTAPDAIIYDKARGLTMTPIIPKEAVDFYGADFGLHPIGSGPFEFVSYSPDDEVVLKANEDYYIKPCLAGVTVKVMPDVSAAMIALEAGDIDWWGSVLPGDDYDRFAPDDRFQIINFGCPVETRTTFSIDKAPFDNIDFRHALSVMRDGKAINAALRGSTHVDGAGTAGPGVAGYVADLGDKYYPYDPELAKTLLDKAGIVDSDGDGFREFNGENLVLPLYSANNDPFPDYVAALVDAGAKVGLKIEPKITDFGTYSASRNNDEFGMYMEAGWCGEGGTNSLWGENGFASPLGYKDQQIFDWLAQAAVATDEAARETELQNATTRIAELYWQSSFGFFNIFTVKRSYVKDFQGGEWTLNLVTDDHNVWIAEDEK